MLHANLTASAKRAAFRARLASGGQQATQSGPVALVGFTPAATAQAITDALADAEASIVAGPKGAGVYEVRFSNDPALAPARQRIADLMARTDVVSYIAVQSGGE